MRRAHVIVGALVLGSSLLASPASAAPAERGPAEVLRHCVVTVAPVENASGKPLPAPRCFATFAEAIWEATEGRVQLPADATTVDQETLDMGLGGNGFETVSATVIGIEYQHRDYYGWSYVIQSTKVQGCAGYSYRVPTLPANRNNEISSAKAFASCKSSHFSGTNMTGSRYLCVCAQMGTMNDQTSSIFFSRTGY
jgi:hypothetical protein